jgi:hypothetical protein
MSTRPLLWITIGVGTLLHVTTGAQALKTGTIEVAQFGVPRDATYLFCVNGNCPERSIKHLQLLTGPALALTPMPTSSPADAPLIVPAKAADMHPPPRVSKKPIKRHKRPPKLSCPPLPSSSP